MALVTLALTSEEVLTYPTADLKDLQPPCSIKSLCRDPRVGCQSGTSSPQGMQATFCTGRPTSWNTFSTPFLKDW